MLHSSTGTEELLYHCLWNELPEMRPTSTVSSTEPLNDISGIWQSSQRRAITQQPLGDDGRGGDVMDSDSLWPIGQDI